MLKPTSLLLRFLPVTAGLLVLAGCPASNQSASSTGATSTSAAAGTTSGVTLTILSPHTREIQTEFTTLWDAKKTGTTLKWLDQGGTSSDLKFVREQFSGRDKTKGIGVDLFFGGGAETFSELERDGLLQPLTSTYGVPAALHGVPLVGNDKNWVAAVLGGFGVLYNKKIASRDKLPVPVTWVDMANPKLRDRIQLADPRHSGSAHTAYEIILQTNGWDKGWKILTAMAGNARVFASSSSMPLQDVQNGEAVFCPAIDFYAMASIERAGADKLGYIEPKGQYILTPDPIGILQGAANAEQAQKFVELVLSPEGQKLWYLPKGSEGGPRENSLFRIPSSPLAYEPIPANALTQSNPFKSKTSARYDAEKAAIRRRALGDLFGAVLVDVHTQVKAAWKARPDLEKTGFVPISEADLLKLAPQWDDPTIAGAKKSEWRAAANKHFAG